MAVFRIQRTKDYTIMSNHHLRDKNLSLKAKGMLSLIFSLPDDWNYSIRGFAAISKEGVDAIGSVLKELEAARYVVRRRLRDESGRITDMEYLVYEVPQPEAPKTPAPNPSDPHPTAPHTEKPDMAEQDIDEPNQKDPTGINKDVSIIQRVNPDLSETHSIHSGAHETKRSERAAKQYDAYHSLILSNIDYDRLCRDRAADLDQIDELVSVMTDAVCTERKALRIGKTDLPVDVVRSRILKINDEHIRFVLDCMKENTTQIRCIRQYLLTALYNAPATISSYYAARVNHDMALDAETVRQ